MSGHVVRTFGVVFVLGTAVRRDFLHESFEVALYGRVRILGNQQRCAGVLHEDVAQAFGDSGTPDDLGHTLGERFEATPARVNANAVANDHGRHQYRIRTTFDLEICGANTMNIASYSSSRSSTLWPLSA